VSEDRERMKGFVNKIERMSFQGFFTIITRLPPCRYFTSVALKTEVESLAHEFFTSVKEKDRSESLAH
jgi:hypothetical protein